MGLTRPVIAFALLKQCSEVMRTDLLGGISILIRPLIGDLAGQRFSAQILSERLASTYGISIQATVLEEFLPRFKDAGIVEAKPLSPNAEEAVFCTTDSTSSVTNDETAFQSVLDEFVTFAEHRLISVSVTIVREKLVEGLLTRLTNLDFVAIQAKPIQIPSEENSRKVLGPTAREDYELDKQIGDEARIDVLVASYLYDLAESNPDRLELVGRVADGALGAELVFDLQAPKQVSDLSKVTVIFDTPLILSLLDLSTHQHRQYAEVLVSTIKKVGAKLAVFRHSVEEAEGVLTAVKNGLLVGNAYGPTADRMRESTYRAFFSTMLGKVGNRLVENHHAEILAPTAGQFYQNFTEAQEEGLTARLHFSLLEKRLARERDASSIAETIRRRAGAYIPNHRIDSCKYVFITSNSSLQRQARAYLLSENFLGKDEFPPVVTDRHFSGLCWLLFGGKSVVSLSVARLLANCANALRSRPDVVDRTKKFLKSIDPVKAQHFEALMTSERAAQFMTEVALGDPLLVTASNAEAIYEQVEAIAAEKVAKQKDEHYGQQLAELNSKLSSAENTLSAVQSTLTQTELDKKANELQAQNLSIGIQDLRSTISQLQLDSEERANESKQLKQALKSAEMDRAEHARVLAETRQTQVALANRESSTQIRWLRFAGIVLTAVVAAFVGYLDKFYIPNLPSGNQPSWNLILVILQVTTAVCSLGVVIEFAMGSIFKSLRQKSFVHRLSEFGWSQGDAKQAYITTQNQLR